MPKRLPPLLPPTTPSFADWFASQPEAVARFVEQAVLSKGFQLPPALGHDLAALVEEVLWLCCRRDAIVDPARWPGRLRAFIRKVALNVVLGWVRAAGSRLPAGYQLPESEDGEDPRSEGPEGADFGFELLDRETRRRILELLDALPPTRARTTLILMLYTGRDFEAIARLLGDTQKNVNSNGSRHARTLFKTSWIERYGWQSWHKTFGDHGREEDPGHEASD